MVAVDGPSGTGKSSTSRGVAEQLDLRFLDTGAMYRALTWWMLRQGVDVDDPEAVARVAGTPQLVSGTDPKAPTITVDGVDVSAAIREAEVTGAVSRVSAVPDVRERLVELQRAVTREASAAGGIVVEGRDIGSVVLPDATLKVYLTASEDARAARRSGELSGTQAGAVQATREDLARRDAADSGRAIAPLTKAGGAVEIDTTQLTLAQVVDGIAALVKEHAASAA